MMHRSRSRLTVAGIAVLVAGVAACSKSSTSTSADVDLTGTYNLTAFSLAGTQQTVDANDGAVLTCTKTTYNTVATGSFVQLGLTDNGTYTALDTATVSGVIYGRFQEESAVNGTGSTGSFTVSATTDTLTENLTTEGGVVVSTWVKAPT